jgi:phospholipase C
MRVPFTVISPWARSHFVSHRVHSHTSVLRFIELLHNLPALTGRDANSDALLDLFNFDCEALKKPPEAPQPPYALCQ